MPPGETRDGIPAAELPSLPEQEKPMCHEMPPGETRDGVPVVELPSLLEQEKLMDTLNMFKFHSGTSPDPEEAANEYEFVIRQLVRTRVVGVSEISDCPENDYIIDSPKPPPERITFTLPVIQSSANVAVVVTGSKKADMVHLAIDDVGSECPSVPAKMIQPINGKLLWFLDEPAASKLGGATQNSV
ncbi:hypothetical protein POM88_015188 [Heracleum sosnowskyi]|uniref:Glucosamine/galactosamine-6-phosphate isomerase domain-containing protein n=1 Tax=Heracleum sosnowskyi TaxID=360622 RepID=A0AAD8IN61_9APIA|nr:hypothetical protein POM88_015188 [Heracleum sosnowskyi]